MLLRGKLDPLFAHPMVMHTTAGFHFENLFAYGINYQLMLLRKGLWRLNFKGIHKVDIRPVLIAVGYMSSNTDECIHLL